MTVNSGNPTLLAGSSVTYTGGATYTIKPWAYQNLILASTGTGTFTLFGSTTVAGNVHVATGTFDIGDSSRALTVGGDWIKSTISTFTHRNSTVTFNGAGVQRLTGDTSFYAVRAITSGATLQFTAGSTQYVTNMVEFRNLSLKSTTDNATWYFAYTGSSQTLSGLRVQDSNALGGSIMNASDGTSTSLGNNRNWLFGIPVPGGLSFTAAAPSSLTAQWNLTDPSGDTYVLQMSTSSSDFANLSSSNTALTQATIDSLSVNTTYFARVATVIAGSTGSWSGSVSTATLANTPATAVSTWTMVSVTSLTVTWTANSNPTDTLYTVRLSTSASLNGASDLSSTTVNLNGTFTGLVPDTNYYAEARAINHSGIATIFTALGSTRTRVSPVPDGLAFTAATPVALTAQWNATTNPAGDSYLLQVSTSVSDFANLSSSHTALTQATVGPLSINTTYYGRVASVVSGSTSPWSASVTTATLANAPATAVSTWTMVSVTSLTVTWTANSNPTGTLYTVRLSTSASLNGASDLSSTTVNLNGTFTGLVPDTNYYAEVRAINHSGIPTAYTALGSTRTHVSPVPDGLAFTATTPVALTAQWNATTNPAGHSYLLQVSTSASDFAGLSSSHTALTQATIGSLSVNTTYFGRVASVVSGSTSPWSASVTTATLANAPATAVSTWTMVSVTSLTVTWSDNGNPADTLYVVRLSTSPSLNGGLDQLSTVATNAATFTGLAPDTVYYANVFARNRRNVPTSATVLGSTRTAQPPAPLALTFPAVAVNGVTGAWTAPDPAGDTYVLQVSTSQADFANLSSSQTALTQATIGGLSVNTTYYGRVASVLSGSTSPWSAVASTVTLANPPATLVSTWTGVGFSSFTVNWSANGNPDGTTYLVRLSTSASFNGSADTSASVAVTSAAFSGLTHSTTYFARVRAINFLNVPTVDVALGSTRTATPPTDLRTWVGATAIWEVPTNWSPVGVPVDGDSVYIPDTANDPIFSSTASLSIVTMDLDTALTIRGGTLTVTGAVSSLGNLILSSSETLTLPGGVWDVDSGTVTYVGVPGGRAFSGLTAGPTYYNLVFSGPQSTWTITQNIRANVWVAVQGGRVDMGASSFGLRAASMEIAGGEFDARSSTLTIAGDMIHSGGDFIAGGSLVDLTASGRLTGFDSLTPLAKVRLAPPAATTTLGSNLTVTGTIEFAGGIATQTSRVEITLASAERDPIVIAVASDLGFSSFTWISSHAAPRVPEFDGYPALSLRSAVAGAGSEFTLLGDVAASTVSVYHVSPATFAALSLDGFALAAEALWLGRSTDTAGGRLVADGGVLSVRGAVSFRHPESVLNLSGSTGTRVGGDFLFGGSTGTLQMANSTITFTGAGPNAQFVAPLGHEFDSVYTTNVSTSGLTFVSSFTANALRADTSSLVSASTVSFAGGSTVTVRSVLDLRGAAGKFVVLRSTQAGLRWHFYAGANRNVDRVDVRDSDASGTSQVVAYNSVDSGNNVNWDFDAPARRNLTATAGPAPREVTLTWQAPADDGATGSPLAGEYRIHYTSSAANAANPAFWSTAAAQIAISTSGVTPGVTVSTSISNLSMGVTYYVRLNAVDDVGRWSGFSNTTTQFVLDDNYPPAPIANLSALVMSSEGEIRLSWTAPDSDLGFESGVPSAAYRLRFSTTGIADLANDTTAWWNQAASTAIAVTPAAPGSAETVLLTMEHFGVTYYYAIRSVDEAGNLSAIDVRAATPGQQAFAASRDEVPPAVTNLEAVGSIGQITLAWTPVTVPDFHVYRVLRSSVSAGALVFYRDLTTRTVSNLIDTGLEDGVTYYYQFVTVDRGAPEYLGVSYTSATAVVYAVPTPMIPREPNINPDETVALSYSQIRWAWDQLVPPSVTEHRFRVAGANVSGALPYPTTTYVQTGLGANEEVVGVVRAINGAGHADSDSYTRHTLARAPLNTEVTEVGKNSITLDWADGGNLKAPRFQIEYSLTSNFASSTTVSSNVSSVTLTGLSAFTTYYIHVRAFNGDGISTAYDVTVATRTKRSNGNGPMAPGGMWGGNGNGGGNGAPGASAVSTLSVSWDPVISDAAGEQTSDVAGYIVKVSSFFPIPYDEDWTESMITAASTEVATTVGETYYVAVRAVNGDGIQSVPSNAIRTSDLRFFAAADDGESYFEYSLDAARRMRASYDGNNGRSRRVHGHELAGHYTNDQVIKSVYFGVYEDLSTTPSSSLMPDGRINLTYTVSGGEILQGSDELRRRQNAAAPPLPAGMAGGEAYESAIDVRNIRTALSRLGSKPVASMSGMNGMVAFWNNGAKWIKLGGTRDASSQAVVMNTTRLGYYQIRVAPLLGDKSLIQVYPRIFTPNGDNANDVVIFQFGEGDIESGQLSGEIFDITGRKVSNLRPGPDPRSTLQWDGKTDSGSDVPGGIYIYQLDIAGTRVNGTVVVAR